MLPRNDRPLRARIGRPLYPTSPWNWDSATPYADVPASFICELAGQWEGNFKTDYNGIYVSGLWDILRGIMPRDSLRIGTITAVNANNTVTCSMASGGELTVRGTGSVSDVVFILNGEVRSTVSGLTTFSATDV